MFLRSCLPLSRILPAAPAISLDAYWEALLVVNIKYAREKVFMTEKGFAFSKKRDYYGGEERRWDENMRFTKMHGCGNDYVYIDGAAQQISQEDKPRVVRFLSDRHFGVGGDGAIFINPSGAADFEMEMYNADGTRAEMCGNGIRCVAKYVYDKGLTDKRQLSIVSAGQVKYLELTVDEENKVSGVKVNMGKPILEPERIPVTLPGERAVDVPIRAGEREYRMTCVSMGNPHAVVFVENVGDMDLERIGPLFEHHDLFPSRTNTEFVEIVDRRHVKMRVWERGTGETLACGTGCCATAVACVLNGLTEDQVTVGVLGGEIEVTWDREENLVYMTGPAATVYEGEIGLDAIPPIAD